LKWCSQEWNSKVESSIDESRQFQTAANLSNGLEGWAILGHSIELACRISKDIDKSSPISEDAMMTSIESTIQSPLDYMVQHRGPAYIGVKHAILDRVVRGRVGDRLPTIRDLAQDMAVSPNNVQRAVRELVDEGVLISRKRLGLFVCAMPGDLGASSAKVGPVTNQTIALMVSREPIARFIERMIHGFEEVMHEAGAKTVRVMLTQQSGVVPPTDCWGSALFNPHGQLQVSDSVQNAIVISTADHLNPGLISRFDQVGVDQQQGGMLAGQVLRATGCDEACFLGRRLSNLSRRYDLTSSSRLHGFEETWGQHLKSGNLLYAPGYSIESGALRFRDYLKLSPRPTAIFAADDDLALGFMAGATSAGLRAGRDYHLVGFDGQDTRSSADNRLTTICVPARQMGRLAAQMMILRAGDPSRPVQRVSLPCSIKVGDTALALRDLSQESAHV
jgi:DNA-binding transcriptional regulator YhcF (GntR family)